MLKEKRGYTPVIELENEILRLKKQGKTRKEISELLLLPNEITVKNALYRYKSRQILVFIEAGIIIGRTKRTHQITMKIFAA